MKRLLEVNVRIQLLVMWLIPAHLVAYYAASESLPGCPEQCGGVDIPYPFGIGDKCAWPGKDGFNVTCKSDSSGISKPYMGDFEINSIKLAEGEMRVFTDVAYFCYDSSSSSSSPSSSWPTRSGRSSFNATGTPFLISSDKNEFVGIGCYTLATLEGRDDGSYFTGCISTCLTYDDAAADGENCTGNGCCKSGIARGLSTIQVRWNNNDSDTNYPRWSPCSYAFVGEKGGYKFNKHDVNGTGGNESFIKHERRDDELVVGTIPLVLDWAIRKDGSCSSGASSSSAAKAPCASNHSECVNASYGNGYRCKCLDGYGGNPYLTGSEKGCRDIDECELKENNNCTKHSKCHNTDGGYECKCTGFYGRGDGKPGKGGCRLILLVYAIAVAAIFAAMVLLAVLLRFVLTEHKRRLRKGFFDKNGGKLLQGVGINIYTEEDLMKMTNRYSECIGKGNFGQIFKGTTQDHKPVAVKCAMVEDSKKTPIGGDFFHEIQFQFQMRHSNLVRLVGCCLERDVPMLVFEFVPNGSLFDMLFDNRRRPLSLVKRVVIALGSAKALAYMHHPHTGDDHKRIHGDVKSGNILLDENLSPKVSDFGSSKVMSASSRYVKFVASDTNYVDPIYMKTYRFTEKSDVYSFGVVLLEIITRKPAKYDGNKSLPIDYVKCYKSEGNGRKMYDKDIMTSDGADSHGYMECLDRIGELAVRCLKEDDDDRPTMAEVAEELKQVKELADDDTQSCSKASC